MMVPLIPPLEGWPFPGAPKFVRQGSYQFEFNVYTGRWCNPSPTHNHVDTSLLLISHPRASDCKTILCLLGGYSFPPASCMPES